MQAYLILANGRILKGKSLGCQGTTVGEVVFATGMVGFEETLTDPSYYGQIITQTYPLIGNYGMNSEDKESGKIWAKGYIVREACTTPSNFRSEETLDTFLKENGIIGIEGIDTRSLTRILRESGVMNGAITTEFDPETEPEKLAALMPIIKAYAVTGAVDAVTCTEPQCFAPTAGVAEGEEPLHIALLDLGCKKNIVRCLCKRGCRVTVLPASTTLAELKALAPDGLMLSNGPGDPAENVQVIANIRDMLDTGIPAFGICLGHQLTAQAGWRRGGHTSFCRFWRLQPGRSAGGPGRCRKLQNEVWPPRRQPACDRLCAGTYLYYQPEPRLCGSGRYFARRYRPRQPCERQR